MSKYIRDSIYKELIYPPKILCLCFIRMVKFYFTPKHKTLDHYSPFQTQYLHATTWSIMTIKLHQRTHPSRASTPPPSRNFTSQIQNSLRLTVKPSIFQEHRVPRNVPFFADPQFPLLSFFLELIPPSHYRHSWPRCTTVVKGTPLVAREGLTFRACRTCFGLSSHRFHGSFAIGWRFRTVVWWLPFLPSLAAHVFLANSGVASTRIRAFFHPGADTSFWQRFDQFNAKSRPILFLFLFLCVSSCFRSVESSGILYQRKIIFFMIFFWIFRVNNGI